MRNLLLIGACIAAGSIAGCKNEEAQSLFDPNASLKPNPSITSISPYSGLAGVTSFTVVGTNFSSAPGENTIYFNTTKGTVLSASASQLVVRPPNVMGDSIQVRVSVFGAELFSNRVLCKLDTAVADFGNLAATEEPHGIACDSSGNVYVSMLKNNLDDGIKMFTPGGVKTSWAPSSGVTWSSLRMGPGGIMYAGRILRALYTIAPNSAPVLWMQITGAKLYDLDFDSQNNLWVVGDNISVYRVKLDKSFKAFPFVCTARSVRVYNNWLYVGGRVDSTEAVFRFPIVNADSLGPVEQYFNLSSLPGYGYNGPGVYSITFNSDGDMYVGTDSPDAIVLVHPDKSSQAYYPGLLKPQSLLFAWGKGPFLYVVRAGDAKGLVRINTQKSSAPYFGR